MTGEGAPDTASKEPDLPTKQPTAGNNCTVCGSAVPDKGYFCPNCGTPIAGAQPTFVPVPVTWTGHPAYRGEVRTQIRPVLKAIGAILIISLIIVLVLEVAALIDGANLVAPAIFDENWSYTLYVIVPFLVHIASLSGNALLGYYLFLICAIVLSVAWVLINSAKGLAKEIQMKGEPKNHSALFDVGGLLFATSFFSVVVALIFSGTRSTPTIGTLSEALLVLASASVWEELVARVLLIGVPLLIIHLVLHRRAALHRYLVGGGFKIGLPETVLIAVSGLMFGYAHYDGGWGLWKIAPAAVAGFALGYLFVRHGLVAAILLHFATDYLTMPGDVFNSIGLQGAIGLTTLVWIGAGAVFFVYFTLRVLEHISGVEIMKSQARPLMTTQTPGVSPYQPVPIPMQAPGSTLQGPDAGNAVRAGTVGHAFGHSYFICPSCGSTQARWINGRFQCLSCGRLS